MNSLHLPILCLGFLAIALSFGESEAGVHHYTIPASEIDSNNPNQHIHKYTIPGKEHTYHYKVPGKNNTHTYHYKVPGTKTKHTYHYKLPGTSNKHTYRYKAPGTTNTHKYRIPGNQPEANPTDVTGVYYVINTIYNYFAVGGHLTGVPPVDLLMLKYYIAQGPKSFCPNGGK